MGSGYGPRRSRLVCDSLEHEGLEYGSVLPPFGNCYFAMLCEHLQEALVRRQV